MPTSQPFLPRTQQPVLRETTLQAGDGTMLPLHLWVPAVEPKATIIALHGFNDHGTAFQLSAELMTARGVLVAAYDQRGFGRNQPFGVWGGVENFIHDAADAVAALKRLYPGVPCYVMGESMGGAVVIVAASRGLLKEADGLILSAPATWGGPTMNPFYRGLSWVLAHTLPGMKLTGRNLGIQASDNIEMLRNLGKDPLFIKRTRVDAIYGIVGMMNAAYLAVPEITQPTLVLYGEKDQVIRPKSTRNAMGRYPAHVRRAVYAEGWHMLLRDHQRAVVVEDVLHWIASPAATLPSGAEARAVEFLERANEVQR